MMLIFREATSVDIPKLLELEQCVVEAERPFNNTIKADNPIYYDLDKLVSSKSANMLVVENETQIVGTGYVEIRPSKQSLRHEKHGYLGFMYVMPEYRGQGLNKEIMQRLIDWAYERDIKDFYLDVYAQNSAAIRAYEKVGFEPCLMEMKLNLD